MRVAALAALVAAATAAPTLRVAAPALAKGWFTQSLPARHQASPIAFTVVVQEQGIDLVKEIALNVSTPGHSQYGEFLNQDQLNEITAPNAEDMGAVTAWLKANGMKYTLQGVSNLKVSTTVEAASKLLNTEFMVFRQLEHNRLTVRATDFELPAAVSGSIATVFGLHGLPLPPRVAMIAAPGGPAAVTPDVLNKQYGISGVKPTGSPKHRQAVAEFQGQFMNSTDLEGYFEKYVTDYKKGTDDKVSKFFGKHEENSGGIEAELDIQYIMGVSVGVQTEFWEFPGNDFCGDLNQWTSNLTAGPDTPLVHSVSYGWQGNLSGIGCHPADTKVVDDNFAKLAAKGVSIMISSGDSGSGYTSEHSCAPGKVGVGIDGEVDEVVTAQEQQQCCEEGEQHKSAGWTFVPHKKVDFVPTGGYNFKEAEFHAIVMGTGGAGGPIHSRDVFTLNGKLKAKGGTVAAKCASGKCKGSISMKFGKQVKQGGGGGGVVEYSRTVTFDAVDMAAVTGKALFIAFPGQPEQCVNIEFAGKGHEIVLERGGNPPPPPVPGTCTLYKTVKKHTTANSSTFSGFAAAAPKAPVLWASWPASSPWVTAVGATRYVGQKVGNEEMATDQFGSGGGFSTMWEQSPDAKYQSAAVAEYLKTVDASTLPPAASFDPKARATPDVSALGEGYQVLVGGHVEAVGGTSASSPMFAGLVSMLNEARFAAGKKQLGFLNPFLYANEDAFTDIVTGSDKVGRGGNKLPYGYNCSKGWDPATGLGTPLFPKLLKAALKLK